jgi:hypothetical protein
MDSQSEQPEPVIVSKFWKNRQRNEHVRVALTRYEGHRLIDVRVYRTDADGIDRPTGRGVALLVNRLPELASAIAKAERQARELGLLGSEGSR